MIRKLSIFIVIICMVHVSCAQITYLPNVIIIKYSNNALLKSTNETPDFVTNIINKNNINKYSPLFHWHNNRKSHNNLTNIYIIEINNQEKLLSYIASLTKLESVEYAQPYYLPVVLGEVNDPMVSGQYYLNLIDAFNAHTITQGDTNIVVGIVDTGIDRYHPDLINSIKYNYNDPINGIDDDMDGFVDNFYGWDVADNDNNPSRQYSSHGSMVAGLVAATCNNNIGIYSIGYNTKVMPIKIMDWRGHLSGAYQGIVFAADHGCQIINCSWGSQIKNALCDDVINYAVNEKNCLVVGAAGNARTDIPYYPAACNGVLNVANTNRYDIKSAKSTYGIEVDICAPGEQVITTFSSQDYLQGWGTSFAAPVVAGCAALVKAMNPDFTGLQLGEQLRITSDIIDTIPDNVYFSKHLGRGRVNAFKALTINNLPSLRVTNYELSGKNSTFLPGDTLSVTFNITNYLKQITNTLVQLNTNSDYAQTTNNSFQTGFLNTLESVSNNNHPMNIILSDKTPYDEILEFEFLFNGYGYEDYQIFKTLIHPSFIDIKIHNIETSITSNGRIGFANSQEKLGIGLIYKGLTNVLSESGIIIGNARDNIASSLLDAFDFNINQVIDTATIDNTFVQGKSSYVCGSKYNNLPIKINHEIRIYHKSELEDVIFHNFEILNKSDNDIDDFVCSIFTDFDIDNSYTNSVEFEKKHNLFYTKSTVDNTTFAGVALISQDTCVPYAFDLVSGGNGGLDIITDFTDNQKWFAMTNPRLADGNTNDTIDVASMLSSQREDLISNDTLKYSFCFIIANSYYELIEKTRLAKNELFPPVINEIVETNRKVKVYPNPTYHQLNISLRNNSEKKNITLYNSQGKIVYKASTNQGNFIIQNNKFKPGVYLISITENEESYIEKVIFTD